MTPRNGHKRPLSYAMEMSISLGGDGGGRGETSAAIEPPRGQIQSAERSPKAPHLQRRENQKVIPGESIVTRGKEGGRQKLIRGNLEAHQRTFHLTTLEEIELMLPKEEIPGGWGGKRDEWRTCEKVSIIKQSLDTNQTEEEESVMSSHRLSGFVFLLFFCCIMILW